MATTEEILTLDVSDGTKMNAFAVHPDGQMAGGILLFQEAFGVNDHIKSVARRLGKEGFSVIAPEFFHRTAPPGFSASHTDFAQIRPHLEKMNRSAIESDIRASYEYLSHSTEKISSVGFCFGGSAAFFANALLDLRSAVSFYGSRIGTEYLDLASSQRAPILFFWGGLDRHILPEIRGAAPAIMQKENKPFIDVVISNADHGFFCEDRSVYNSDAAKLSWTLVLNFIRQHLD